MCKDPFPDKVTVTGSGHRDVDTPSWAPPSTPSWVSPWQAPSKAWTISILQTRQQDSTRSRNWLRSTDARQPGLTPGLSAHVLWPCHLLFLWLPVNSAILKGSWIQKTRRRSGIHSRASVAWLHAGVKCDIRFQTDWQMDRCLDPGSLRPVLPRQQEFQEPLGVLTCNHAWEQAPRKPPKSRFPSPPSAHH